MIYFEKIDFSSIIIKDQDGLIDKSDLKKFLDEFLPEEEAPGKINCLIWCKIDEF